MRTNGACPTLVAHAVQRRALSNQQRRLYLPFSCAPTWNALRKIDVSRKRTEHDEPTLDGTLDLVGYQLFRDGLLPQSNVAGRVLPKLPDITLNAAARRRLRRERDAAVAAMRAHGVTVRRSVKETAITIGCDEAGRGPLAGPVVGAAVARLPISSFNNPFEQLYDAPEQFQVFDSKSVSESQRNLVFAMVTGHVDFFDIAAARPFTVHHCGHEGAASKRTPSHAQLSRLTLRKLLSMQTPYLISYRGANSAGNYLYLWSIGMANHAYIDLNNIYSASMDTMHCAALGIWKMLSDPRFSQELAPRPRQSTIAQYLFTRFCRAANHDHDRRYRVPHHVELAKGASDFFGFEPVQAPLVLVDGHAVPESSYAYFTDPSIGGDVQPLIEGDKRSLSIAAASCLAKVSRDEVMNYLDKLYPGYCFTDNKGYPVEQHMKYVAKHGLCPVHRKTFRPCKRVLEKQQRMKEKEKKR